MEKISKSAADVTARSDRDDAGWMIRNSASRTGSWEVVYCFSGMNWIAVAVAVVLCCASCATSQGAKCPEKPYCIGPMRCTANRHTGCEVCQCDAMVDELQRRNSDPTRRPGDPL